MTIYNPVNPTKQSELKSAAENLKIIPQYASNLNPHMANFNDKSSCNDPTLKSSVVSLERLNTSSDEIPIISLSGPSSAVQASICSSKLTICSNPDTLELFEENINSTVASIYNREQFAKEVKNEELVAAHDNIPFSANPNPKSYLDIYCSPLKKQKFLNDSVEFLEMTPPPNSPPTILIRVPVENTEKYAIALENGNENIASLLKNVNHQDGYQQFESIHSMSKQIFRPENGYNTKEADRLLSYNRTLIERHNRWPDIRPWSHNIVTLNTPVIDIQKNYFSNHDIRTPIDYVNASYLQLDEQQFIAASAPTTTSFDHYWKMVFEQGSDTIVMLTKLLENRRVKAHCYWPADIGCRENFGDVYVTCTGIELISTNVCKRTFSLTCNGNTRVVSHFHYTGWPDMGRPDNTDEFINLMEAIREAHCESTGPIVTHCSAGCGRVGTFVIAYAYSRKILQDLNVLSNLQSVFDYKINLPIRVLKIREQRPDMVQRPEQYVFIKEVLAAYAKKCLERKDQE